MPSIDLKEIGQVLEAVRTLAIRYYELTGKPLGVTGEMAEFEAARILGLELCAARQDGYDAVRAKGRGPRRIQIKGRRIMEASKPGQRLGEIKLKKEWDSVMLVLLDEQYRATAIYEAERPAVKDAIEAPGSKARNVRGALGVSKFKSIGRLVWQKEPSASVKAAAKTGKPPSASLRPEGLAYLAEKLSKSAGMSAELGINGSGHLDRIVTVSRLYPPQQSWAGRYAWWHTIPESKFKDPNSRTLLILCRRMDEKGFHILAVPTKWLRAHRDQLDVKNGKLQLFLAATGDDMFIDQRGRGKVDFSQWVKG